MANSPHLFDNLVLSEVGKVDGINDGLEIAGKGTFKLKLVDDDCRTHIIRIPNSLYLPKLKSCLLSPQHWAQEAGDRQTWMINGAHHCILQWADGQKTVPFNKSSNTSKSHRRERAAEQAAISQRIFRPDLDQT